MTLARAEKKNALTSAMYNAMSDGLERAEKDPAVRVVLFQGDGDGFTSGNDIADFSTQANGSNAGESQAFRFIRNLIGLRPGQRGGAGCRFARQGLAGRRSSDQTAGRLS